MQENTEEFLEITDSHGKIISIAPRSEIHGNPSLIHRVVHVLVFNKNKCLFLQKRSETKDVAPGKWDTSVGGHVNSGEDLLQAAKREMEEELGISNSLPEFLYTYIHTNSYETELVYTYSCIYDGSISFNKEEIDEVRLWDLKEIKDHLGRNIFSDNFEHEISTYLKFSGGMPTGQRQS